MRKNKSWLLVTVLLLLSNMAQAQLLNTNITVFSLETRPDLVMLFRYDTNVLGKGYHLPENYTAEATSVSKSYNDGITNVRPKDILVVKYKTPPMVISAERQEKINQGRVPVPRMVVLFTHSGNVHARVTHNTRMLMPANSTTLLGMAAYTEVGGITALTWTGPDHRDSPEYDLWTDYWTP